jgi:GDP/UDP-N,N'-diacetylbacillosamine 2-epimerase (hydrolysing)
MKILFFTGSRGEWGYIRPILEVCKKEKINFKICVTNMHLLDSYGKSINEIFKDGFKVEEKIYMALDGYNSFTMIKSMGVLLTSFSDTLNRVKPDWVVVAGDRAESLIATIASSYANIPVAHIQAGELSGVIDGQARHAIGKFSHLHFASNSDAERRLLKLGEEKFRVKKVGAPQLDDFKKLPKDLKTMRKIESKFNFKLKDYFLVVYHPPQQKIENIEKDFSILSKFLNERKEKKIWISPNNDAGSSIIKTNFLKSRDIKNYLFDNLPRQEYLHLLKNAKCIIGNSSSGIIESPSFKVPCINIGFRQHGRIQAKNVLNIKKLTYKKLKKAVSKIESKIFLKKLYKLKNPYGDGNSSKKIIECLKKTKIDDKLMFKKLTY